MLSPVVKVSAWDKWSAPAGPTDVLSLSVCPVLLTSVVPGSGVSFFTALPEKVATSSAARAPVTVSFRGVLAGLV